MYHNRVSSCETVLRLHKKNYQLLEIMKDKSAAGGSTGSKRKHAGSGKALGSGVSLSKHNSLVSFDFINRIITSLYGYV